MTARPPWSTSFAGGFEESWFESQVLRSNRLGDPHATHRREYRYPTGIRYRAERLSP